jgi:hypothetical protein
MPSIRKKYRKMRIKFEEKMRDSNVWFVEEQLAVETARRLAEENELAPRSNMDDVELTLRFSVVY